ncbi:hypothetical protein [Burkholderia reimsis]|uniref:hypothetical protein n=1 Tax=Burkholderia reimsis TaxID=2234132 RepID=UPI001058711C|nr:hypothetical protein [Burkholderia reimsis]
MLAPHRGVYDARRQAERLRFDDAKGNEMEFPESALTKHEWLERCIARYLMRSSIGREEARRYAEALYLLRQAPLAIIPEVAGDGDMTYWK